jgi:hypothetical protein
MIDDITRRLFAETPGTTLYHYTSLSGLQGIIDSGILRASDIRYMNDSTELRHTLELLRNHITDRISSGTDRPGLLNKLQDWLSHRVVSGPMLFGASFRANGNLLSQWRGYSVHGKGASLGFSPSHIAHCAHDQGFRVGRCVYDPDRQQSLIEQIVDAVENMAANEPSDFESWQGIFESIEERLLCIAAILKHPAFEEEQEWRIVSPAISNCGEAPIYFREGSSMLVPYYAFNLHDGPRLRLDHVYLGPTNNIDLSMNSLRLYLDKKGVSPTRGISYCQIPYRQR